LKEVFPVKKFLGITMAVFMLVSLFATFASAAATNLVTNPNLATATNLDGLAVRDSAAVGTELKTGGGYQGSNAIRVFNRASVDNSPIFLAPNVVKGKTYDISAWVKMEDPNENGVLVHLCYAVPSVEAYFVPLPTGTETDNAFRVTGNDWVKLEVKDFTIENGATAGGNDFGLFLTTWSGPVPYLISDVRIIESGTDTGESENGTESESGNPSTGDNNVSQLSIMLFVMAALTVSILLVVKKRSANY